MARKLYIREATKLELIEEAETTLYLMIKVINDVNCQINEKEVNQKSYIGTIIILLKY